MSLRIARASPMDRFASGAWLTLRRAALVAGLCLVATIARVGDVFVGRTGPHGTLDAAGRPVGTDFTLIWTAGRLALEGRAADVYAWDIFERAQHAAHGADGIGFLGWHYPPPFLAVASLVALLPYLPALIAWQAVTLGAALAVIRRILPAPATLLVAAGAPAVWVCLAHGHNAFLTAALFGGALAALGGGRPILAGILFGCLSYKPQFGLVIPLALACGAYWRTIAAAAATAAALALASLVLFGVAPWEGFIATADLTRRVVLEDGGTGWYKIGSAFSLVRGAGGPVALAYAVQGAVTAAVLFTLGSIWRRRAPFELRASALIFGALLATPYLLDYDLAIAGPAIAFAAAHGLRNGFRRWEIPCLAAAWLVPAVARYLSFYAGLPAAFLLTALPFCLVVARAMAEGQGAVSRTAASAPRSPRPAPG